MIEGERSRMIERSKSKAEVMPFSHQGGEEEWWNEDEERKRQRIVVAFLSKSLWWTVWQRVILTRKDTQDNAEHLRLEWRNTETVPVYITDRLYCSSTHPSTGEEGTRVRELWVVRYVLHLSFGTTQIKLALFLWLFYIKVNKNGKKNQIIKSADQQIIHH